MLLGHSIQASAKRLRKGHWLTHEDVDTLVAGGSGEVFAGQREDDDILENDAALAIAKRVVSSFISHEAPHTGRCNLQANADGLLVYRREHLIAFNLVDQRITLALLPPMSPVRAGDLVGTVKIIPFAVPSAALTAATGAWPVAQALSVAPYRGGAAHLLETTLPSVKPLSDKIISFTRARAERVGFHLQGYQSAAHHPAKVAKWLKETSKSCDPDDALLIFGASAAVDEADVIPKAIADAGGAVERVGMAADPGNLLVYGRIGKCRVIGLPGCAKSPALNGFDWVLERVAAGLEITPRDWAEFSVGGLLKEIEARPQPRRMKSTLS